MFGLAVNLSEPRRAAKISPKLEAQ